MTRPQRIFLVLFMVTLIGIDGCQNPTDAIITSVVCAAAAVMFVALAGPAE